MSNNIVPNDVPEEEFSDEEISGSEHGEEPPDLGHPATDDEEDDENLEVDILAKDWLAEKAEKEAVRLRGLGVKPLVLKVKNYGVLREVDHVRPILINRVEIETGFDLNRIRQVLVAESEEYPHKEGFRAANVLLFTENMTLPILIPYIYPASGNDLKEWLLINARGLRSRQSIGEFHDL
ncbi:hypothetical protein HKX48_002335 [Thoreauomyces humboldtii]|nr:hypothetical protein HKX48_002335 [Thoreauomyces humboldtii]